jgi:hypothetical protein
MAIEFPNTSKTSGTDPKTNGAEPETAVADAPVASEETQPVPARTSRLASGVMGVLLIAALVAGGWLWLERQTLTAQVADLNAQVEAAAARETEVQTGVGDIAEQLGALQAAVAGLLGGTSSDAAPTQAEAVAPVAEEAPAGTEESVEVQAAPGAAAGEGAAPEFSWTERALEGAGSATEPAPVR